jgi:hypothetical protein
MRHEQHEFGTRNNIMILFISMRCLSADRRLLTPDCVLNAQRGLHIEIYSMAELGVD